MSGPNKSEKGAVFVALFSGINVGGNRIVKMAELKSFFEGLGFTDVATYVQSGNVVFRAKKGEHTWRGGERSTAGWFEHLVKDNPYPKVAGEPTKLHAYALEREPTAQETKRLADKCAGPERFEIKGDVLYLHAPDGLGKSVFANLIPRTLKVPGTARNWRSVLALLEMAGKAGG